MVPWVGQFHLHELGVLAMKVVHLVGIPAHRDMFAGAVFEIERREIDRQLPNLSIRQPAMQHDPIQARSDLSNSMG